MGGGVVRTGFRYERLASDGIAGSGLRLRYGPGMDCHRPAYGDDPQLGVHLREAAPLYHSGE